MPEIILSGINCNQPRLILAENGTIITLEERSVWQAAGPVDSMDASGALGTAFRTG
jgi:hypothetical protein